MSSPDRRFEAIFASCGAAMLLFDDSGRCQQANRAACELLALTHEQLVGAAGIASISDALWQALTPLSSEDRLSGVLEHVVLAGRERALEYQASARVLPGLHLLVLRDITELMAARLANARLAAIVEFSPDAMLAVDQHGIIRLVNAQAEHVFGHSRDELVGRSIQVLVPAALRAGHAGQIDRYVRAPRHRTGHGGGHLKALRKDGTEFDAEITLRPVQDDCGLTIVAAVRDVTESNRLRDQLILSDRMISIGTLAAGVAHEINNPLAAIIANVDLALAALEAGIHDPERRRDLVEGLEDSREAAQRVRQIVHDMKMFSRSEEEALQPVDAHRVLETILRMAAVEIRHRARIVRNYGQIPLVRACDSRLGQVFMNLLVNASQAIGDGDPEQNEIRITTFAAGPSEVVIEIADTGAGMSEDTLKRVFTPFFTTKPIGVGTGLGLSISQRLVTSFGGSISVESSLGAGSVFRIQLRAASEAARSVAPSSSGASARRRSGRVLVIDDDPMIVNSVRRALHGDHEVITLTSALAAIELLETGARFDVLLCDLMMPQMSGIDFHRHLSEHVPEQASRIVFMTGGAFTPSARTFLDEVANLRIHKPFDVAALRAMVSAQVR